MKTIIRFSSLFFIFILLLWTGCKTTKPKVTSADYSGVYNWSITTDNGDMSGNITLTKNGDTYTGTIGGDQGTQDMTNLKVDGTNITANFTYMSYEVSLKATLSDSDLKGSFSADGYDFPFDAKKQAK